MRIFILSFFAMVWLAISALAQTESSLELTPELKKKVEKSIDAGIRFLRQSQNAEGHWGDPGITALALTAIFRSPRRYGPEDGPWVRKPLAYLVQCQKGDGGIYADQLANYITSVSVMAISTHPEVRKQHEEVLKKAQNFLTRLQCDEGEGYTPGEDKFYGGFGYGSSERPDLSNTQFALEALQESGLDSEHEAFKKAVVFLQRCQNRSESNDQTWAGNDGGFVYYPGNSFAGSEILPNGQKGLRSYGSMTYAGIKSYIYAQVKKDDPRVQAAYEWISHHYSLEENPGVGAQGLFYYYTTMAKTLALLEEPGVIDEQGNRHNWRSDLAQCLLAKQRQDGSWINEADRWWEGNPTLATAYSVLALCYALEEK